MASASPPYRSVALARHRPLEREHASKAVLVVAVRERRVNRAVVVAEREDGVVDPTAVVEVEHEREDGLD
jgi:hypothetical protein